MAEYTLRDPQSGRTITVRGDSPPSEQEAEQLFASAQAPTTAPTQAAPVAEQAQPGRAPLDSTGAGGAMTGLALPEFIANRVRSPNTYRIGAPIAAGIAFPPAGVGMGISAIAGAVAGLSGEGIAQEIEGKSNIGEMARGFLYGGIPQFAAGGSMLKNAIKPVLAMVGAETTAETINRSIEQGKFATYESLSEMKTVIPAAAMGAVFGQTSAMKPMAEARTARIAIFKEAGVNPTLDMIIPHFSELGVKVRQFNAAAMNELIESERPVIQAFQELFPEAVTNEKVRAELVPYLGKLDGQKASYFAAKTKSAQMAEAVAVAAQDVRTAPAQLREMRKLATAAQFDEVNQHARLILDSQGLFGSAATNTSVAETTAAVVIKLKDARKAHSDELFQAAGIDAEEPLFRLGDIYAKAKSGVSGKASTDAAKRVLATISGLADEKLGSDTMLTLNQVRELRGQFSKQFEGLGPADLNMAESVASTGYSAALKATEDTIGSIDPKMLGQYREAVSYYAQTSQAMNSRYVKAVLNKEPLEGVFKSLATDIAGGNISEVVAFNKFISAVATDGTDVAKMAQKQFSNAIRNSVLANAAGEFGGTVDPRKAVALLSKFPKEVPVASLGFGSKEFIADWAKTFREYGIKEVPTEVLNEAFTSPAFQNAILANKGASSVARPVAARIAFERNARMDYLKRAAGIKQSVDELGKAKRIAKDANMDEVAQKQFLEKLEADPIMREFAGGEKWGVTATASEGSKEIINSIIGAGERGEQFLRTIRATKPELSALIEARYISEKMQSFFTPATTRTGATWQVNRGKVEEFLSTLSVRPTDTPEGMAKAFMTPERLDKFKKVVRVFAELNDIDKKSGIAFSSSSGELARAFGMTQSFAAGRGTSSGTILGTAAKHAARWVNTGRWKMASAMLGDNAFANAVFKADGNVVKALDAVGPGKAYLLVKQHPSLAEYASEQAQGDN